MREFYPKYLIGEHITLSCKNNAQKLPQVLLLDTEDPGLLHDQTQFVRSTISSQCFAFFPVS